MTAVKKYEGEPLPVPAAVTPMDMIQQAVASGGGVDMVEKLMTLQERWEASQGRREFDQAIAAAKAEIPIIQKNRQAHNGKYADFAAYARVVDPILSRHGLSYRFRSTQENGIRVTCILSHSAGHFEESTLVGPEDKSGSKNAIQAIGSTLTYLQRYTLIQALGLAASDDDDADVVGARKKMTSAQARRDHWPQFEDQLSRCTDREGLVEVWNELKEDAEFMPNGYVEGCKDAILSHANHLGIEMKGAAE
jgi:hypothetical protein